MISLHRLFGIATASAVLSHGSLASAGGFATARYTAEHGHPVTDNATSIYFNPGAMTRGEGTRLLLDVNVALRSATYERRARPSDVAPPPGPAGDPDRYADANAGENSLFNVLAGPTIGLISEVDDLAFGILLHAPFGGAAQYGKNEKYEDDPLYAGPVDGVQRHYTITGSLRSLYISPGVAYEVGDQLSVGVAFNLINSSVETTRAKNLGNDNDITTEGRARLIVTGWQWSFGAGVMWEAVEDELWIGASYQAQPNVSGGMRLDGSQQNYFVRSNGSVQEGTEPATLTQTYPDVIRLGGAMQASKQLEVRVFGDYQRWSVFEDQCVSPKDEDCDTRENGEGTPGTIVLQNARRNWNDTLGARAGVSYWTNEKRDLELMGGLGWDGNAAPNDTLEPALADSNKVHLAAGARFALSDDLHLAASYTHLQYIPRDNEGASIQHTLRGASRGPDAGGRYESWVGIFNTNLEIGF